MTRSRSIKVFISYSHKDIRVAEAIHKALEEASPPIYTEVWRDKTRLKPQEKWTRSIAGALAASDIVILLWSRHAAASKTVRHEWLTGRALGKEIIPYMVEPYHELPDECFLPADLWRYQTIDFQPDHHKGGIRELLDILRPPVAIKRKWDYSEITCPNLMAFGPSKTFVGREMELLDLYMLLIGELHPVGINQAVGTTGMGGIGKTQLAVEFAWRFAHAYPGGIFWINATHRDNWISSFVAIADALRLGVEHTDAGDAHVRTLNRLRGHLAGSEPKLIVMDNVEDPHELDDELVPGFRPTALGCTLLFTTRSQIFPETAHHYQIGSLSKDEARSLLASYVPAERPNEKQAADEICRKFGYLPLAIKMAGSILRQSEGQISYSSYLENLDRPLKTLHQYTLRGTLETHQPEILTAFISQYEAVSNRNARDLFWTAGQLPKADLIPRRRLSLLAGLTDSNEGIERPFTQALTQLVNLCLVETIKDGQLLRLHPLLWEFSNGLLSQRKSRALRFKSAKNLYKGYVDFASVEAEYDDRGIDSVTKDIEIGTTWAKEKTRAHTELQGILRVLDRERINLRHDSAHSSGPAAIFAQQIWYRAQGLGLSTWSTAAQKAVEASGAPFLTPINKGLSEDPLLIRIFKGHSHQVVRTAFSPDGKLVLSGTDRGEIFLWDTATARKIRTLRPPFDLRTNIGFVHILAFMPNGKFALSDAWRDGLFCDVSTGKADNLLDVSGTRITVAALSPDGSHLVLEQNIGLVLWDLMTPEFRILEDPRMQIKAIAFADEGRQILTVSSTGKVVRWDTATGKALWTKETGWHVSSAGAVFSQDGNFLVVSRWDSIDKLDLNTGKQKRLFKMATLTPHCFDLSPNGRHIIVGLNNVVVLGDIKKAKWLRRFYGHSDRINDLHFSSDGAHVISGAGDKTVILWDVSKVESLRIAPRHSRLVRDVSLSHSGKLALSVGDDNTLMLWDAETAMCLRTEIKSDHLNAVCFAPDSKSAVIARRLSISLIQPPKWREIGCVPYTSAFPSTVALSPDGKLVLYGCTDGSVAIYDTPKEGGRLARKLTAFNDDDYVCSVDFSTDGRLALAASQKSGVHIYDLETLNLIHTNQAHDDWVWDARFVSNSSRVLSASQDGTVGLWDVDTDMPMRFFRGHAGSVLAVACSPDGKHAISGSEDHSLILWNIESGEPRLRVFTASPIFSVDWKANRIFAGHRSGQVSFFEIKGLGWNN